MEKYWYRIDFIDGKDSRMLIGTSEYEPAELVKQLRGDEYLLLSDLSYRDNQNRFISWSTWDPRLESVAYINPKYIISVMPFVGDPRPGGEENQ
ncbi:MAG TPA: hypothetical protein VHS31_16185 [Tepidisphaeraceae bacterium]|jgi:hypothetical protein|nr:hypothetical protein [Tepidisphaeraceae bacterium]